MTDGPYCSTCEIHRVITPGSKCPVCKDDATANDIIDNRSHRCGARLPIDHGTLVCSLSAGHLNAHLTVRVDGSETPWVKGQIL